MIIWFWPRLSNIFRMIFAPPCEYGVTHRSETGGRGAAIQEVSGHRGFNQMELL
jgi:hypothetical protein